MQKFILTLSIIFSLVIYSYGQGTFGVSINGGAGIPVGKFADDFNTGYIVEGTIFWKINFNHQLYLTSGYQRFGFSDSRAQKDFKLNNPGLILEIDVPVSIVPVVIGSKYYFPNSDINPFISLELGYNYYSANVDAIVTGGDSDIVINETKSGTRVAYNFGIGVDIDLNKNVDLTFHSRYHSSQILELIKLEESQYRFGVKSRQHISLVGGINYYF